MAATDKAHWWLTEFRGVKFRATNPNTDISRAFQVDTLNPTGTPFGSYALDGARARMLDQQASFEFIYPAGYYLQSATWWDQLMAAAQSGGTLKKTDGQRVLQTEANLLSVQDATTIDDIANHHKRTQLTFRCEPFWYSDPAKSVSFTSVTSVALNTAARRNEGNARAVKYLTLIITTGITASEVSPFVITIAPNFGQSATLNLIANMAASITINPGSGYVLANGVNVYRYTTRSAIQQPLLFLEGKQLISDGTLTTNSATITFTSAVSGVLAFRDTWV